MPVTRLNRGVPYTHYIARFIRGHHRGKAVTEKEVAQLSARTTVREYVVSWSSPPRKKDRQTEKTNVATIGAGGHAFEHAPNNDEPLCTADMNDERTTICTGAKERCSPNEEGPGMSHTVCKVVK